MAGCRPPDAGRGDEAGRAYLRLVAAEDARPAGGRNLRVLTEATADPDPGVRLVGVRALGRLERPALAEEIEPLLADPAPSVRAEAANALAQSVKLGDGARVLSPLLGRASKEENPWVRGILARSLGRLRLSVEDRRRVSRALLVLSRGDHNVDPPPEQLIGSVLGLEAFGRIGRDMPLGSAVEARLHELARYRSGDSETDDTRPARVREVALAALGARGLLGGKEVRDALADADARVRWAAASALARWPEPAPLDLVDITLGDSLARVRTEGVRALSVGLRDAAHCSRLTWAAGGDVDAGVRSMALDALGMPCPAAAAAMAVLERVAGSLPADPSGLWQPAAHAFLSLSRVDTGRARTLLPRFVVHANPFVRSYAARAATLLSDPQALLTLASDTDANTRAEALDGLARVRGHSVDSLLVVALANDDAPQVLMAIAPDLADTERRADARDAALATLQRLGRTGQETLRDARLALMDLVGAMGGPDDAHEVEPFLRDRDPAVAERAAHVLARWTGEPYLAAPRPPARLPLPTPTELRDMEHGEVVLTLQRGGSIRLRLLPFQAPTTSHRLYSMVRAGTLDGLTFHRVVPDFVIQGGSPLANEYAGNGAFTRDEVGLTVQWRGTVGVSTRGRDTGDGQIYINLVDNIRLDHDYTILGVVISGMDAVDAVLEGDGIARATFDPGG